MKSGFEFRILAGEFVIEQLPIDMPLGNIFEMQGFFSVTRTATEVSVIRGFNVGREAQDDVLIWKAIQLDGPLSFELTGVLSRYLSVLASAAIPILTISTFDTDYIFVPAKALPKAADTLQSAGCQLLNDN